LILPWAFFLKSLTVEFHAASPQQHGGKAPPYRWLWFFKLRRGSASPQKWINDSSESRRLSAVCGGKAAEPVRRSQVEIKIIT
jgi:hypothetical protein